MINDLCHIIDKSLKVTLNVLINIGGDAEEVCNFTHIETIYYYKIAPHYWGGGLFLHESPYLAVCAKFGPDLTSKTPTMLPLVSHKTLFVLAMSILRPIPIPVPNLVPIGPTV